MTLLMNSQGEFVDEWTPNPDENRARVYANCARIDPKRLKVREVQGTVKVCRNCNVKFVPKAKNQLYCTERCRKAAVKRRAVARELGR